MRVCLTVQGEQPMSSAASEIVSGGPSGEAAEGREDGPGSARIGPGWPGQCPGQRWPRGSGEKPCKRVGLRVLGSRAFGEYEALLRSMMISAGTSEYSGQHAPEEVRQLYVEVPEKAEHEAD
jgi:hypothetical protein